MFPPRYNPIIRLKLLQRKLQKKITENNPFHKKRVNFLQKKLDSLESTYDKYAHTQARLYDAFFRDVQGKRMEAERKLEEIAQQHEQEKADLTTSFQNSYRMQEESYKKELGGIKTTIENLQEQVQMTASLGLRNLFHSLTKEPLKSFAERHGVDDIPEMYAIADAKNQQEIERLREKFRAQTSNVLIETIEGAHKMAQTFSKASGRTIKFSRIPYAIYSKNTGIELNGFDTRIEKHEREVKRVISEALEGTLPRKPIRIGPYKLHIVPHNLFNKPTAVSAYLIKEKRRGSSKKAGTLRRSYEKIAESLPEILESTLRGIRTRYDLETNLSR